MATQADGSSFTFSKRINASNFARNNDGRVERLEKPSSNRKYSIDNSDNRRYSISRITGTQKDELFRQVSSHLSSYIDEQVAKGKNLADLLEELASEHSSHREKLLGGYRATARDFEVRKDDKDHRQTVVEAHWPEAKTWTENREAKIKEAYDLFTSQIKEVVDYAGVLYREIVIDRESASRNPEGGIQLHSWRDAERQRAEREAGTHQNSIRPTSRSDESGFSIARSMDELKVEAREAFPNADVQEQGNKLIMTMPNGQKVTVTLHENITASQEELSKAKREHGVDEGATVTVEGYAETVGEEGFVALSQGSREGTGFHEAYHIAEAMAFTKKELADAKRLISANEEERADAYAKWKLERKKGNNFAKLWQKIADVAAKLAGILGYETKRNIFRKVESGEIYRRDNTARDVTRKYSIDSADNSQESYLHRVKNFFSKSRAADTPEYRRMLKGMMEEIAGIKIRYGKIDPKMAAVYDSFKKVIRAKSANDWERVLPLFAGATLEKLGVKPNEKLNAYISDWIQTGAPNNNSKEAVIFQKAMKDNPEVADQLIDLQEAFQRWDKMNAMERGQNIISWQNQEYRKHCHGCNGYTLIGQGFGGCRGLAKNI